MGIVETNKWLEEHFDDPLEICQKVLQEERANAKDFYRYLVKFGMYKPNKQSRETFELLQKNNVWKSVAAILKKYKTKWRGPDIPIFIFPMSERSQLFLRTNPNKSGLSFRDKLFLFLTSDINEQEIEALFVHEYHHVCRINRSKKEISDFTLLDSIILEGLAEYAVEECCGKEYLGKWCHLYSKEQIEQYSIKYLAKNLSLKKDTRKHDQLLFGGGNNPVLLGYAAGYAIVSEYKKSHSLSLKDTFTIGSEQFAHLI